MELTDGTYIATRQMHVLDPSWGLLALLPLDHVAVTDNGTWGHTRGITFPARILAGHEDGLAEYDGAEPKSAGY